MYVQWILHTQFLWWAELPHHFIPQSRITPVSHRLPLIRVFSTVLASKLVRQSKTICSATLWACSVLLPCIMVSWALLWEPLFRTGWQILGSPPVVVNNASVLVIIAILHLERVYSHLQNLHLPYHLNSRPTSTRVSYNIFGLGREKLTCTSMKHDSVGSGDFFCECSGSAVDFNYTILMPIMLYVVPHYQPIIITY